MYEPTSIIIVRIPIDTTASNLQNVREYFSQHSISDEYHTIIIVKETCNEVTFEVLSSEGVPPLNIETLKNKLYEIFPNTTDYTKL